MELRTFEGTWEEISQLGPELAGRRVRLTVLDVARPETMLDSALGSILEDAERLASLSPCPGPSPLGDEWSEGVAEKFRGQGFEL